MLADEGVLDEHTFESAFKDHPAGVALITARPPDARPRGTRSVQPWRPLKRGLSLLMT